MGTSYVGCCQKIQERKEMNIDKLLINAIKEERRLIRGAKELSRNYKRTMSLEGMKKIMRDIEALDDKEIK